MRKSAYLIVATSLVLAAVAMFVLAGRPSSGASLYTENAIIDFGSVNQGDTATSEFVLVNKDASNPIHIDAVHTSCSCTVSTLKLETLAPGEQTTLAAAMTTKGSRGDVSSRVVLAYRLGSGPPRQLMLQMKGNVIPEYELSCNRMIFSQDKLERSIEVMPHEKLPGFNITNAYTTRSDFKVESVSKPDADGRCIVQVRSLREEPLQQGEAAHLSLETSSLVQPTVKIPIVFSK